MKFKMHYISEWRKIIRRFTKLLGARLVLKSCLKFTNWLFIECKTQYMWYKISHPLTSIGCILCVLKFKIIFSLLRSIVPSHKLKTQTNFLPLFVNLYVEGLFINYVTPLRGGDRPYLQAPYMSKRLSLSLSNQSRGSKGEDNSFQYYWCVLHYHLFIVTLK